MKSIKFEFTEIKTFDVEKERNRINQCFEGEIRLKLLKILDLFCEEKFQESYGEDVTPEEEFGKRIKVLVFL